MNIRGLEINDRLWCNTGGETEECTVSKIWKRYETPALKGCVLVNFDNGSRQWMDAKYLKYRGLDTVPPDKKEFI